MRAALHGAPQYSKNYSEGPGKIAVTLFKLALSLLHLIITATAPGRGRSLPPGGVSGDSLLAAARLNRIIVETVGV